MSDPKTRFSQQAQSYVIYRPNYPAAVFDLIDSLLNQSKAIIADVGSGTGIFTEGLLRRNHHVIGVEPNQAMREKANEKLKRYENFISVNGAAEKTSLDADQIDMITVAMALHWFDCEKTKQEFRRILKPDHYCFLVWNKFDPSQNTFTAGFVDILKTYTKDFNVLTTSDDDSDINLFFAKPYQKVAYPNKQLLDQIGVQGRMASISYMPTKNEPMYQSVYDELTRLFERTSQKGQVELCYQTIGCYGFI